jgi:hypothetical protein
MQVDSMQVGGTSVSNTILTVTSANNTSAGIDMMGDLSGTKGFRVKYEGNGNYFSILDNTSSVLTERFRIDANGYVTMPNQPAFEVSATGGGFAAPQYVPFNNKYFDIENDFSTTTYLFTAPVDGLYFFYWTSIGGNVASTYRYYLHINGANTGGGDLHLRLPPSGTNYDYGTALHTTSLSSGDTVGVYYGAGSADSYASADYTRFGGHLIA